MDGNAGLESIDRLNSYLTTALVQIGRTFRDANGTDSKVFGTARGQEPRMELISKANTKFHEVLDEIEIEILQAKAVLERDLNGIRVAREERERGLDGTKSLPSVVGDLSASVGDGTALLAGDITDTTMLDSLEDFATAGSTGLDPAALAAITGDEPKAGANPATNGDASTSDPTAQAATTATSAAGDSGIQAATDGGTDGVDAVNAAFDFDSMFGGDGSDQPFDLDFGDSAGDGGAAGGLSMDDIFNEMGNSTGDFAELGGATSGAGGGTGGGAGEDLDSLLPGLESYVNVDSNDLTASGTGDDFAMVDLPATGSINDAAASTGAAQSGSTATAGQSDGSKAAGGDATDGTTADNITSQDDTGDDGNTGQGQDGSGDMGSMDDIFGDMLDVGNMEGASLDDFDWNM